MTRRAGRLGWTTDRVLAQYEATRGQWVGLAPSDVAAAAADLGLDEAGPWPASDAKEIVSRMELLARRRRPRYRAVLISGGRFSAIWGPGAGVTGDAVEDEAFEPAGGDAIGIVIDPEGGYDNFDAVAARFRELDRVEHANDQLNATARLHAAGATVAEAASAVGLSKRTLQERRGALRKLGTNPDSLGPANE